jgi:hypothetical protein
MYIVKVGLGEVEEEVVADLLMGILMQVVWRLRMAMEVEVGEVVEEEEEALFQLNVVVDFVRHLAIVEGVVEVEADLYLAVVVYFEWGLMVGEVEEGVDLQMKKMEVIFLLSYWNSIHYPKMEVVGVLMNFIGFEYSQLTSWSKIFQQEQQH